MCLKASTTYSHVLVDLTCSVAIILYAIWYLRNQAIFRGLIPNTEEALSLIQTWQKQYIRNNKRTSVWGHNCLQQELFVSFLQRTSKRYSHIMTIQLDKIKVHGSKCTKCRCIFIKDGILIRCEIYRTRNGLALELWLFIGLNLKDLMLGGEVETHSLIQLYSKNRRLQVVFQDASTRPNNLKALMYDIVQMVNDLSAMISLVPSSGLFEGFRKVFRTKIVNYGRWFFLPSVILC